MKIYKFLGTALIALSVFGCTNPASNTTTANTANAPSAASPTETLKTFIQASKKKDIATIKKTLSKGTLELAEKAAQTQKISVDELLQRGNSDMVDESLEMRNEKIENDTASVEVKNFTDGYDTIPFVKENGEWKVAFDKYQQEMMEKVRQEMNESAIKGATNSANQNSTANQKPGASVNKPTANK